LSFREQFPILLRTAWRRLRAPLCLLVGLTVGFLPPYLIYLDSQVRVRFDDLAWDLPSRVYARPLSFNIGDPLSAQTLLLELDAARYTVDAVASTPGTYNRQGDRFIIARRAFDAIEGRERDRRIGVELSGARVAHVRDPDSGAEIIGARLDPARIATLYGPEQQERRVLRLDNVPPLLVAGLQAVEDRDFKHHHGINVLSILRAAFANLMAGRVVQGGSTLTQQLVKNLFLDSGQRLTRKINEALISLLIEARYDKGRILEAYLNEVFLGQQGGQAVHGFGAASEYYFGRELKALDPSEIALLVGLAQGASWYDPRRNPERALSRRNLVLQQFYDTGLLKDEAQLTKARNAPLGVSAKPGLPRNRYPAFLDLVRTQLARDYPEAVLRSEGLAIHTTLAPATQSLAEQALATQLDIMAKKQPDLQGAMVVTGARDGEVQALIGARDAEEPGFDRAIDARRPIGSLVKPFVYLVALAQPQRYSLVSMLDDAPVDIKQPDGSHWMPQNAEHEAHGRVMLIEALVHSYNLATIHLGLLLGVERVQGLLQSFALGEPINPNPSLLLGAWDLSPLQVARLYQYFAADGHALPLRSVRGVVDAKGKPLTRYEVVPGAGDYVAAARLVSYAMQQVAISGTGHSIGDSALAGLHAAGKTGTSDSQRDSWFAGFSGAHLAVVWVGRDDNKPTGLMGATGALKVWAALFARLPTAPLDLPLTEMEQAWVNPQSGMRTVAECAGSRQFPFLPGYAPQGEERCAANDGVASDGVPGGDGVPIR
jgi:penicillin-binding protein 1B